VPLPIFGPIQNLLAQGLPFGVIAWPVGFGGDYDIEWHLTMAIPNFNFATPFIAEVLALGDPAMAGNAFWETLSWHSITLDIPPPPEFTIGAGSLHTIPDAARVSLWITAGTGPAQDVDLWSGNFEAVKVSHP